MDDRRLEHLLKLAMEADELESSASRPALRLVGGSRRKWMLPFAGGMAAAAAMIAVATMVLPALKPAPAPFKTIADLDPTKRKVEPVSTGDFSKPMPSEPIQIANSEGESSVVLAFFQGLDGKCTCMHIQDENWDGDQLQSKDRRELLDVAFQSTCLGPSPKILVVGIAGKPGSLPRTAEEAEALIAHLNNAPPGSRTDLSSYAYEAMPQLPAGSTIVAESYCHGRNMLTQPAKFTR